MQLIFFIIPLILGGLLNLSFKPGENVVPKVALAYVIAMMCLSACSWLFWFARIKNAFMVEVLAGILTWGLATGYMALGFLMIRILSALMNLEDYASGYLKRTIRLILLGLSVLTGNIFIIGTAGKATDYACSWCFFQSSGYSIWFLYLIMIAEPLGGLGLLLHYKLKTGPFAAACLMLIMIGALYTHRHNNAPFSDSYPALIQFTLLALMQAAYYFEKLVTHPITGSGPALLTA